MSPTPKTFRLGIAMAGAVSAGAYTAGVMDYLLETLQRWQEAKDRNRTLGEDHPEYDPSIPMHDVVIEVMGGSSAGGMTAAITALGLFEGVDIEEWDPQKKRLYDAWVNLNDQADGTTTLEQLLDTKDILTAGELPSLLNSKAIDQIADRARNLRRTDQLPPYISRDLEVILTITSLRGIPISVNFFDSLDSQKETSKQKMGSSAQEGLPAHKMYQHKGVAHFKFDLDGKGTPEYTLPFHPDSERSTELLLDCAKATGAFPIGLKARKLEGIGLDYIKAMVYRMFGIDTEKEKSARSGIDITTDSDPFSLMAIDGGTMNNEPFGEIIRALEENCAVKGDDHALIMIDPFPNFELRETVPEERQHPSNVIDLLPNILGAIRAQAMVKEREIVRGLSSDHSRKMIFPKKTDDEFPIACGSLDGFGGFFCKSFREHDYYLGRRNCQRFLRKHLSIHLQAAKTHYLFSDWKSDGSDARHNRFFVKFSEKAGDGGYPLIPDLGIEAMSRELFYDPYEAEPEKPGISSQDVLALDKKIQNRIRHILLYLFKTKRETVDHYSPETRAYVSGIMESHFHRGNIFQRLFSRLLNRLARSLWRGMVTRGLARRFSRMVIGEILLDFKKRGLLR